MYLGIDAGFSAQGRSTGLCLIDPFAKNPVRSIHVRTAETTAAITDLLSSRAPIAASIDGPLLLSNSGLRFTTANRYRECERMLSGGIFQKRCKPGATNTPRGFALHRQATSIANFLLRTFPGIIIHEAFPNAFLGVMLPDSAFRVPIRRGIKSDVFWENCVNGTTLMRRLLNRLFPGTLAIRLLKAATKLNDHDERAAFVCALVARGSETQANFMVGNGADGAISLPPANCIQPWALDELRIRCGPTGNTGAILA